MTRLRSILIALVALALSAGAVFAGHLASAASGGLQTGTEAAGKVVPVQAEDEDTDQDDQTADETTDETTDEDVTAAGTHPDNHGALVSAAARGETLAPADFVGNHGAFVSSIARQNSGQTTSEEHRAGHGKPEGAGKPSH